MQDLPDWKDVAIEAVRATNAPCTKYADKLLEFVLKYGVGPKAEHIEFLDMVAKQFGCNVPLGQSFWAAVTDTAFVTDGRPQNPISRHLGLNVQPTSHEIYHLSFVAYICYCTKFEK